MLEELIEAPELRGAALELGKCTDLEACMDGPAGCIAGETLIYDPIYGKSISVETLYDRQIAPTVQTLVGPIKAEIPFIKGRKELYRVTLEDGKSCVVTMDHRVLSLNGWVFVSSLKLWHYIAIAGDEDSSCALFRRVVSIEYVRTDIYYDLHVPSVEHYLADDIWHHNTGKTFACLYKVHMLLSSYPGAKALVARKTSVALASTAIATYKAMLDPREGVTFFSGNRIRPAAFEYPNGSQMILTGLDKPEKVKSLEIDIAYINEATECDLQDIEFVRSRLRHNKTPYHQILMDVNPEGPTHWLNLRMNAGITKRLVSRFQDNPRFYDQDGRLTPDGDIYINKILAGLTGVRLMRLFYGKWVGAEGAIYADTWEKSRNVVKPYRIPSDWPRYLAVDFGFKHPFVCLWAALDPDGRIIVYREWYKTNMIVEDHAKIIKKLSRWGLPGGEPPPRQIICDHDAEDRATLERHLGMMTTKAFKEVRTGIQAVQARFRDAGDGRARLEVFENALVERDTILDAEKKPCGLIEEIDSYVWAMNHDGSYKHDEPVKEYDHSCLVAGTRVTTSIGDVPIEYVKKGDFVLTRNGYREVEASGMTEKDAQIITACFSNGKQIKSTLYHPFYVEGHGFMPLSLIDYGSRMRSKDDEIVTLLTCKSSNYRYDVFNITVKKMHDEEDGEYFANSLLVHNCDPVRYLCSRFDRTPGKASYKKTIWK